MEATKLQKLKDTVEGYLHCIFNDESQARLHEIFANDFSGFGTNRDEEYYSLNDLIRGLKRIRRQEKGLDVSIKHDIVFEKFFSNEMAYLMVDQCEISISNQGDQQKLTMRGTSIFEYLNDTWKVIHFHGSFPANAENDLWLLHSLQKEREHLEKVVEERTKELEVKTEQLIHQEKLASLGQLTAGIAHEIKNPINFINNFSELCIELIDDVFAEWDGPHEAQSKEEVISILKDIKVNLGKVVQHGKRADNIVKSMLQHSRTGSVKKEPTDINVLIGEFVNLAFHSLRAQNRNLNVKISLDTDPKTGCIPLIAEDFSRVVLNLCNNAFDAMSDKQSSIDDGSYSPELKISTRKEGNMVIMVFEDNGPGVSTEIQDKIMQPFFTTKKGTQGTGLGLSISFDIIKSLGGTIKLESVPSQFTRFVVSLPLP
jgi:signal transduction histidine kinase